MYIFVFLLLMQFPLNFGAPTTLAPAEIPKCGRCGWLPRWVLGNYTINKPGYKLASFGETIKKKKSADGCLEAEFICPQGSYVKYAIPDFYDLKEMPVEKFNKQHGNKLFCSSIARWHTLDGFSVSGGRLFCLKKE